MNLYIDIDGVLLGKVKPEDSDVGLARHANEFLLTATEHFDCYWLTTHCKGDIRTVLDYLRPYCDGEITKLLSRIRPTSFRTLKTEALEGDFLWIDDSPLAVEQSWLEERGILDRWVLVDTRKRPDDLLGTIAMLRDRAASALPRTASPTGR